MGVIISSFKDCFKSSKNNIPKKEECNINIALSSEINQNGLNPMLMNQMGINQMMMNQMGLNPMLINNQPNQINPIGMDNTTLNIKNIVQPYFIFRFN